MRDFLNSKRAAWAKESEFNRRIWIYGNYVIDLLTIPGPKALKMLLRPIRSQRHKGIFGFRMEQEWRKIRSL
jgi:hypothetical protein